ncbi:hypothetical protein HH214_06155 [Mucilaginibacter robiniae]|uniref:Uncharacterized protein n=1 Tax=Mucilaginibacter robiniae TaxID=2728022 RepID=A0A7L5DWT1_9SPHI|nr:hypothetical protein [Mucilaginibacter robiniae]QJD95485.1 hypothetical protein HH214_06155 [Mucilaginibacter robiniae]
MRTYPAILLTLDLQNALHHYWLTFDRGLYLIRDEKDAYQGAIARRPDGSWQRISGKRFPASAVGRMGDAIDHFEYLSEQSFGFGLDVDGELLYCEVLLGQHGYRIYLHHEFVGEIRMNFDWQWEVVFGQLPAPMLLGDIGARIEQHFA